MGLCVSPALSPPPAGSARPRGPKPGAGSTSTCRKTLASQPSQGVGRECPKLAEARASASPGVPSAGVLCHESKTQLSGAGKERGPPPSGPLPLGPRIEHPGRSRADRGPQGPGGQGESRPLRRGSLGAGCGGRAQGSLVSSLLVVASHSSKQKEQSAKQ